MRRKLWLFSFLAAFMAAGQPAEGAGGQDPNRSGATVGKYGARIALDRKDGIYKSGETAVCRITLTCGGKPLKGIKARMTMKWEARVIATRDFETTGSPVEFSYRSDKPGWVYWGFEVLDENGTPLSGPGVCKHRMKKTVVSEIGAVFDKDRIASPVREPDDFDEFWAKRRAEVRAAPLEPELTELDSGIAGIRLFAVRFPVVRGIMASGYLAYPANARRGSLPAQIFFQSMTYGDVRRETALVPAARGALAFAATWHGLPCGRESGYYRQTLRRYHQGGDRGFGDREKWVGGNMFFRVMRELDFLKNRPEWDGRTLIVSGGSLGGSQAAFAAMIDRDVTLALINVPSGCECNAAEAGRTPYRVFRRNPDPAAFDFGFYFDTVNFGRRITCEVYVCTGFTDENCCPSNVIAFYNAIPATTKKTLTTDPRTGHFGMTVNVKGNARVAEIFRSIEIGDLPPGTP